MTKSIALLLGAGSIALVIVIALLVRSGCRGTPPENRVEITAPKGTQVFARLPDGSEQHLGDLIENSLTVDVRIDATIALRYKDGEKTFPPEKWRGIKLIENFDDTGGRRHAPPVVTVSINAVPWAEVFLKLPGTDRFIEPPEKKSNVTPIRGGLKVPVGTAIKLVYGDKEKAFGYEAWKTSKTISHDFMEP